MVNGRKILEQIKILVIEDDREINQLVSKYLLKNGFLVDSVYNGSDALEKFRSTSYQMAILDLMIPYVNGYEVLRKIREKTNFPVLILSAKSSESDKVIGLGLGADDYMSKPFSIEEFIARVKAQLRRYMDFGNSSAEASVLRHLDLELDLNTYRVKIAGRPITLTNKEFEILKLLMKQPNMVFTKAQIFNLVWQEEYVSDENTVMVHIRRLREKIEVDPSNPRYIHTVWGIGYKLGEV